MARYIDAEALTAEFKRLTLGENSLIERIFADGVYAVIDTFPTADVAPKSEVERLRSENADLQEQIAEITKRQLPSYYRACSEEEAINIGREYGKTEVARDIFSEIDALFWRYMNDNDYSTGELEYDIAELKKKYTEDQT